MQAHNFDPSTGFYLGSCSADPDREQPGAWLFPAFSTATPPPAVMVPGQVAVYVRASDSWAVVDLPPAPPPPVEPTGAELAAVAARAERNRRLQGADVEVNKAEDAGADATPWRQYRQALRAWPASIGFPDLATLPELPA